LEDGKGIDLPSRLRLIGFTLFSAIYFLSFFHDMAVPVVGDDLVSDLSLDASALGFMSSGFLVLYALTQPAIGLLSDRIGPERASAGALLIGALGSFLAVQADGFTFAFLGRIMMGTGLAAGFIPGMKLIAVMFRRKVFTTYNALFAGIGNLSCLVGTVPLTRLAATMEWRQVFAGLGVVSVLVAGSSWAFARMRSAHTMSATGPERGGLLGLLARCVKKPSPLVSWILLIYEIRVSSCFPGIVGHPVSIQRLPGRLKLSRKSSDHDSHRLCLRGPGHGVARGHHGRARHGPLCCKDVRSHKDYYLLCFDMDTHSLGSGITALPCHVRPTVHYGHMCQLLQFGLCRSKRPIPVEGVRICLWPCESHVHSRRSHGASCSWLVHKTAGCPRPSRRSTILQSAYPVSRSCCFSLGI